MTVSRKIEVTFDAPNNETADWFADFLRRVVMNDPWGSMEDARRFDDFTITGQAFSSEPVATEVSGGA